uniref:Uncharacterized protein n=1 Tax=Setaria italica TaxID=4555 RepID=K3Z1R2_SETIT
MDPVTPYCVHNSFPILSKRKTNISHANFGEQQKSSTISGNTGQN